jgi:hypothetical protein
VQRDGNVEILRAVCDWDGAIFGEFTFISADVVPRKMMETAMPERVWPKLCHGAKFGGEVCARRAQDAARRHCQDEPGGSHYLDIELPKNGVLHEVQDECKV